MPDSLISRLAAVLTDTASAGGILLTGPPGIGRTRLTRLVLDACAGRALVRRPGDLPVPPAGSASQRYAATTRALHRLAAGRTPVVLGVDDLHLLDPGIARMVEHLADAQVVRLLATAPSDATGAAPVAPLLRRGVLRRHRVPPLSPAEVGAAVTAILGGRADSVTVAELWRHTQGNPRLLRVLLEAAPAAGTLIQRAGTWRWTGRMPLDGMRDAVRVLVGEVPAAAVRFLAVAGSVPVAVLERLADQRTLERLEEREVIRVDREGGELVVRLSQPLHTALLLERMTPGGMSETLRELVGAGRAVGVDHVRLADWRLRGGLPVAPRRLLAAAEAALTRGEATLAQRLAGGVGTPLGDAVVAQALVVDGRVAEAETAFGRLADQLPPRLQALRIVNLLWGLRRPDEAVRLAGDALAALESPYPPELELAREALALFTTAVAGTAPAAPPPDDPLLASTAAAVRGYRMIFSGRPGRIVEEHHDDLVWPSMRGSARACHVHALVLTGRLTTARTVAADYYDAAAGRGEPAELAPLAMQRGVCEWWAGNPARAMPFLGEAAALLDDRVPYPVQAYVSSEYAVCLAALGDRARAGRVLAEARAALPPGAPLRDHLLVGEIRVLALTGELSAAAGASVRRAARNLREGRLTSAAEGYYLAVRLTGDPAAARRLTEVAGRCDGDLLGLFAAHATALVEDDGDGLRAVAEQFAAGGYLGFALEAVTSAARLAQRAGDDRAAAELSRRAARLTLACDGFRPPWLHPTQRSVRLGARELEACELAAEGLDNQQIAERMGIALRTVTNHLARAYAKLGVRARQDLAGALAALK
ncbi:LuxR C-terminal-related transcriptional regulator [Actinoplanes sp. NPDC049681]|uniref:LuxR C-terminal-related transcriptional regulator n=1 Tax=Actinoplanes sp. NPDC049681 TaxID=3363905 RepID=UPI0037A12D1A